MMPSGKVLLFVAFWLLATIYLLYIYNNDFKIYIGRRIETSDRNATEAKQSVLGFAFEAEQPKVPFLYWERHEQDELQLNASCAPFPDLIKDLAYHNDYWQTYRPRRGVSYQLYGAYLDRRLDFGERRQPVVRILAMVSGLKGSLDEQYAESGAEIPAPPSHCHLWYEDDENGAECCRARVVPLVKHDLLWNRKWLAKNSSVDLYYPYMLACDAPDGVTAPPYAVSLVARPCARASNNLRVWSTEALPETPPHGYAICVKGLNYPYTDYAARLVEWLELQRLLGARRVYMYLLNIEPQLRRVLAHYEAQGFVELTAHSLVVGVSRLPHWQQYALQYLLTVKRFDEVVVYNDCFFRHKQKYSHLAIMDLDDVLMPLAGYSSLQRLLTDMSTQVGCAAGICFRHVYFPSETDVDRPDHQAPPYMHMLRHTQRNVNYSMTRTNDVKCLHSSANAFAVHNHLPLSWRQHCMPLIVNITYGQLQHYRAVSTANMTLVEDRSVWRWKDQLLERTQNTLRDLQLLRFS